MAQTRSIEGHTDFGVLEARLAQLIREVKRRDPPGALAPVAIVAPTRRLLAHLQVRLAEEFPGLLNVHFFHHDALARAAAHAVPSAVPRPIAAVVREAILAEAIRTIGGGLAEYVEARPRCVPALLRTMDDLREAGVNHLTSRPIEGLTGGGRELFRVYAAYTASLEVLAGASLADRAGGLRSARRALESFAGRFDLVVHYGAYELIGSNLELMKSVEASGTRVVYLVPHHRSAPAFAYARDYWPEMLGSAASDIRGAASDRALGDRLAALYDESAAPHPVPQGLVSFFHAQGAAAELREAALRVLALHRDEKIPLGRIALIARSLEPYAPILAPVFAECALPFVTSASVGALREGRVQAVLHLGRAALGDFDRQPLMDLLRSGQPRLPGSDPEAEAHAWDRLGREWRITRGFEAWTRDLPRWIENWEPFVPPDAGPDERSQAAAFKAARLKQARSLASAVGTLKRLAMPIRSAASWRAWADAMRDLCESLFGPFDGAEGEEAAEPAARVIQDALADMRDVGVAGVPFSGARALAFLEHALAEATVPVLSPGSAGDSGAEDNGGVRVLDAMQSRGLAFDAVFLIGMNGLLFPRRAREDPFLDDGDRRLVRKRLAAPLAIKAAAADEEHLLLAHLLGGWRRRLIVSWQRADEDGRAQAPSLALREVARLVFGQPDLERIEREAVRVPSHPGDAGRDAVERHGLLPPSEARLDAALELGAPGSLREALPRLPRADTLGGVGALAAGLEMLAAVDRAEPGEDDDLRYDAFVGDAAPPPQTWSPSRLEALGACPQYYFFRHVLRVEELEEPAEGYEIDVSELGGVVHEVLRDVYAGLVEARRIGGPSPDSTEALREAERLAARSWEARASRLAARMRPRYPLLWEATSSLWLEALRRFLAEDLAKLIGENARVIGLEEEVPPATLSLGGRAAISLRGRFDRVVRLGNGDVLISDYKTSGNLERLVSLSEMLKGSRLQIPLYILMAEARLGDWSARGSTVRAEVVGVGPAFAAEEERLEVDPGKFLRCREGLLETLGALIDLADSGRFPLNDKSRICAYCPYVRACRKTHPPTLERLSRSPGGAVVAVLRAKNTTTPTFEAVRRRSAGREGA